MVEMDLDELPGDARQCLVVIAQERQMRHAGRDHAAGGEFDWEMNNGHGVATLRGKSGATRLPILPANLRGLRARGRS